MGYRPRMSVTLHAPAREPVLELSASQSNLSQARLALGDLGRLFQMWQLCWSLAFLDITLRYRGSMLGPFWLTLSTAIMVGSMGFLYSALFHMDMHSYFPFIALSIVLWNFINTLVNDSCTCFTAAESLIRSVRIPISLYAVRVVLRNLMVLAHNVVVIVVVDVSLSAEPGWTGLLAIPAFLMWIVVGVALVLLLGTLSARFRDIPPIIASVMQMAFFVSGVIWQPSQLKQYEYLLALNPFFSLLEVVRAPLLGQVPSLPIYASAIGYSAFLLVIASLLFVRTRGRIAFWV